MPGQRKPPNARSWIGKPTPSFNVNEAIQCCIGFQFFGLILERLQFLALPRDDISGSVKALLVVVAQAHQAAGCAEQLLIIFKRPLITLLVLGAAEATISEELLA